MVWRPWFPRVAVAVAVVGMSLLNAPAASSRRRTGSHWLAGLLDGYDAPPIHHAAVLIDGNRISGVGPAAEIEIPPTTPSWTRRGGR